MSVNTVSNENTSRMMSVLIPIKTQTPTEDIEKE